MNRLIAGWDVGGAHVKLAILNDVGQVLTVAQRLCPLWKGVEYLHATLADLRAEHDLQYCRHALTMTGELVDCFTSREQGVTAIIQAVCAHFAAERVWVFAGLRGFLPVAQIQAVDCMDIASANWLASLILVAKRQANTLFVDVGSTTTDILLVENHQLKVQGFTDYDRLVSGELVYTGIIRTAVMALAPEAEFNGRHMGLMAEYFATMADVYRLTGDLNEAHDQSDTADGAEKSILASARRLSRLTGYEFNDAELALWCGFAAHLKAIQIQKIRQACVRQMSRLSESQPVTIVGAGVGRFLVKSIALELRLDYLDFADVLVESQQKISTDAADCAPAVAVAFLAAGFG